MTERAANIMIVAGEASGDLYGARLAAKLKEVLPSIEIRGIGGRRMREADVELLYDSSSWSAIGIAEALKLVPGLYFVLLKLQAQLKAHPPDVLVLIDFGTFNVRLGRSLHSAGVKVLYYFPPSSWYRGANYSRLDGVVDRVVTPFPWSAEALRKSGFQADFFGHPLLDVVKPSLSRNAFCERFGFDIERPVIGLLPGSRTQEIVHNLPALVIAAARMLEAMPELQFAIPLATSVNPERIASELACVPWISAESYKAAGDSSSSADRAFRFSAAGRVRALAREDGFATPGSRVCVKLLPGMTYDVLAYSRAAVVTSGTATVESMILGCPMVIVYRGNRLTRLEFRLLGKRIKFIGMPNIILDRAICPELIAGEASPRRISELALKLIPDSPERAEMLNNLAEARAVLGRPGAIEKTAHVVLELLDISAAGGDRADNYVKSTRQEN